MVFVPEKFTVPAVSPDTASLFRRAPYLSPSEYQAAPTAVGTGGLVPGGSQEENQGQLLSVINRASGWLDAICFHRADGTLAASPSTESAWVRPKDDGTLMLVCNYKPILACTALAVGTGPSNMSSLGNEGAEAITIQGPVIMLAPVSSVFQAFSAFPPRIRGRTYAVWEYVNGYPHTLLATEAKAGATSIKVEPSEPGGTEVAGIFPGTQLTIHDGANTEIVVVHEVEGLTLKLTSALQYGHVLPSAAFDSIRVSAIPYDVEQACISLVSCLIKTRGTRAMTLPQAMPGGGSPGQVAIQAGGLQDFEIAYELLKPYIVPVLRTQ